MLWIASVTAFGQNNVIDEVVWVVGDEAILKSDVETARMDAQYNGRTFDGDPYCIIPEELAIQKLFLHQAEIDSVMVTEQEIVGELDMRVNWLMDQIGSKEKLEEYYNKTMTQIREMIRENIRNEQTVRKMKNEIVGDVKIVPADVRRYFNSLPADSIPFIPTQVEVQIITQQPKIPQAEIERVKKTLRDFTERIEKGEISFGALARLYSVDKVTARRGGESGYFQSKGELVPEFANVVFNLTDPKKVSKVIETEYGYHIAQLIERRGDRINYRHILLRPEVEERELDASLNRLDSLAKDIRNGKFTFDEAAMYVSHDKDTRNNHGLMANPETRTARFEMQELAQVSQEIAKTVNEMNVGEVSEPFVMINRQGKEVCAIVKLKARIDGHKATIAEDYQRLKAVVQEKLGEEKLMKWIAQKQKTTYVRINDDWKKCDFKYPGWNIQ
jgi:peptidyl-prolyl cis-trans isomerase SurA